ncbi:MAG: DUF4082 domain-containing protein [Chitinophagaceae bacterium]
MRVCFSTIGFRRYFAGLDMGRKFFCSLILTSLFIPATLFSQTTPLSFNPIPYSDPDIISPGRGAEQWDNGNEKVNNPISDSNQRPLDVYYRFSWTKLEGDSLGSYDWKFFDNIMHEAIDNHQKLSFGIMPVYDGNGTVFYDGARAAYPLYLHKLMQSGVANTRDWVSNGVWIPNWNSVHYLGRLKALHVALNAHILASSYKGVAYKNAIYCIDVRGYGNYGEWHNAGIVDHISEYPEGRRATTGTLRTIIAYHTQVFALWPLTIMAAVFDAEQFDAIMNPAEVTNYALITRNSWGPLGWRRDQWGATDSYLDKILKNNEKTYGTSPAFKEWITTRYLTSPVTGEPPRYVNEGGPCEYWDLERQLTDYGATSLGNGNWGVTLSECGMQNARAAFKRAGYRIILNGGSVSTNIAAGKPLSITLKWKNIGIAPTYENWDVVFELKNDNNVTVWSGTSWFKPKRFAPSVTDSVVTDFFKLPDTIIFSKYKLNLIIKDPTGYRAPFPLAITGRNADGSYTIKDSRISPVNCTPPAAAISASSSCSGKAFDLILNSASGRSPYDLVINGVTYNDVTVGKTITTITPPAQKIWTSNPSPTSYEDSPVELGLKFKSSVAGFIKGIRFFSSNSPSGIYTGHLWTVSGTLLDSARFSNVTANGWQEVLFAKPLMIKADTTYVASYHAGSGHYSATSGGLINATTNGSLTALANTVSGGNGMYSYGTSPVFPTTSFNSTNYWVDVVFTAASYTLNLTSVTDSTGCNNSGALQTLTVSSASTCDTTPPVLPTATIGNSSACNGQQFNLVLNAASGVSPYDLVINGTTYNDVKVGQVINTIKPQLQIQKIWDSIPATKSFEDSPVELGVKFKSSSGGFIKGIRFFSSNAPSGTYTGHLWTKTGTLLDSAVFTNVKASGWQEILFKKPILIKADSIYVASYHTANGRYAATSGGLLTAVTNRSLTALDNVSAGGNGVYSYGPSPTFPFTSANAANYWADVIFVKDTTQTYTFTLTSVTDSTGATKAGALQTLTVSSTNTCDTVPQALPTANIANTSSCNGQPFNLVLNSATGPGPYDLVINGTTYNDITVGQVINTIKPPSKKIWDSIPAPKSFEDSPVELGLKFKSSAAGFVKGIRFFSPNAPSGIYTGHLWTKTGTLIDSAVFANVTASGWQEVLFKNPALIKADSIYIASYHTASGHYAATSGGLLTAVTNGSLTALDNLSAGGNGVYTYGPSPAFPSSSNNAANYWVDVLFTNDTTHAYTFTLTSVTDNAGATRTGTLQTLTVTSANCSQALRSRGTTSAVENASLPQLLSPVTKQTKIKTEEIKVYQLGQNFPNPFRNQTRIQYSLPVASNVNLSLFDMNGRLIKVIVNGSREQGTHTVIFNSGFLSSGLYFYKIQAENFSAVKKMIIH